MDNSEIKEIKLVPSSAPSSPSLSSSSSASLPSVKVKRNVIGDNEKKFIVSLIHDDVLVPVSPVLVPVVSNSIPLSIPSFTSIAITLDYSLDFSSYTFSLSRFSTPIDPLVSLSSTSVGALGGSQVTMNGVYQSRSSIKPWIPSSMN
jgi:hypothetical protein